MHAILWLIVVCFCTTLLFANVLFGWICIIVLGNFVNQSISISISPAKVTVGKIVKLWISMFFNVLFWFNSAISSDTYMPTVAATCRKSRNVAYSNCHALCTQQQFHILRNDVKFLWIICFGRVFTFVFLCVQPLHTVQKKSWKIIRDTHYIPY